MKCAYSDVKGQKLLQLQITAQINQNIMAFLETLFKMVVISFLCFPTFPKENKTRKNAVCFKSSTCQWYIQNHGMVSQYEYLVVIKRKLGVNKGFDMKKHRGQLLEKAEILSMERQIT